MAFFRIRTVLEELEAHLQATGGVPGPAGKSERKRYAGGEERLKVRARGLPVPDGTPVSIVIAGATIAQVPAERGRIRLDLSSGSSGEQPVPAVSAGDVLEIRASSGDSLLRGVYRPE